MKRLDRSDTTGTSLRTYRLKYGSAPKIAAILNNIYVGRSGGTNETPSNQVAPGVNTAQSRLDSLGPGSFDRGVNTGNPTPQSGMANISFNRAGGQITQAFDAVGDRRAEADPSSTASLRSGVSNGRGVFQNVRITPDVTDNSIVIYSNQEDYRIIEQAVRRLDRPLLQVAIEATVAEVTLTDGLEFGIQYFLKSQDVGLKANQGSAGLFNAAAQAAQSAAIQRVLPGANLLLGPEAQPRLILNALSTITNVKVLSSPNLVVVNNQPAILQVGDQIPLTTSTATLLSNSTTPVVNTIEMRNTGVILKVLPQVNANGTILLEIEQEISNVLNQDQQSLTPSISQRRVHSTVAVTSGQTVLLGGLISEREEKTLSGIPGLRQIEFLGNLFGNTSGTKRRSEIIIFIRPQLIRNNVDARNVAEEFRDRLDSMRSTNSMIDGWVPPATAPVSRVRK